MKILLIILWVIGYTFTLIGYLWKKDKSKFIIWTIIYGLLAGLILSMVIG